MTAKRKSSEKETQVQKKILDTSCDGKQREVTMSYDSNGYTVEKNGLNSPYCQTFKKRIDAQNAFDEQVSDTHN